MRGICEAGGPAVILTIVVDVYMLVYRHNVIIYI